MSIAYSNRLLKVGGLTTEIHWRPSALLSRLLSTGRDPSGLPDAVEKPPPNQTGSGAGTR